MTPQSTLLWFLVIIIDTFGQLSFKAAATKAHTATGFLRWKAMLTNMWIWCGIFAYVFEFFLWLAFLTLVPLSLGVLVGSINIIAVMIGGRIFFGEKLTQKRIIATVLISTGVALVGWS